MGRGAILVALVVAAMAAASPAQAAITSSRVTTPADPTVLDIDHDAPGQITVSGTTTGGTDGELVDLVCTYGKDSEGPTIVGGQDRPLAGGAFTATVARDVFEFWNCVLRAVPDGGLPADLTPFTGPQISGNVHRLYAVSGGPHAGQLFDYYQDVAAPQAYWDGASTGGGFLRTTYVMNPTTLAYNQPLFGYAGVFGAGVGVPARASLQVDGRNAYLPADLRELVGDDAVLQRPGFAPLQDFTRSFDPLTRDVTLAAGEPAMFCAQSAPHPPQLSDCATITPAGLIDRASTHGDHGGRLVTHTDRWTNTGSGARQLDVWYETQTGSTIQWQLPGQSGYAPRLPGDHTGPGGTLPSPPAGPASVFIATNPNADGEPESRGSVTWSAPPQDIHFDAPGRLRLRYTRTIPPGGTATITLAYAHGFTQASVEALTLDAIAAVKPAIAITAPADGATTATQPVTVTGTVTDNGPAEVEVNGVEAPVAADGTWSAQVALQTGANTLTATATDEDGNTATATGTITFAPPATATPTPTPPPAATPTPTPIGPGGTRPPSNAFTFTIGRLKRGAKQVVVTAKLPGRGTLKGAVSRKRGRRTQSLGSRSLTATKAGTVRLTIKLSRQALALIRSRRTVKATLRLTFTPTGGRAATRSKSLTLRRR